VSTLRHDYYLHKIGKDLHINITLFGDYRRCKIIIKEEFTHEKLISFKHAHTKADKKIIEHDK